MAADDVKREYHLTPAGWVRGTVRFFSQVSGAEVPRPSDAVATYEHREYDASVYSQTDFSVRELWRSPSADDARLLALFDEYGPPEEGNTARTQPWKKLYSSFKAL